VNFNSRSLFLFRVIIFGGIGKILNFNIREKKKMAGKFEILKSASGYRFNLKSGNGEIVLSSENYESESAARKGAESVMNNAMQDARYERKTDASGAGYFVLKAGNGEIIGRSETYSSEQALEKGVQAVKMNASDASIVSG
jgi:uncharacterized protein YegP (UPF0339 family)